MVLTCVVAVTPYFLQNISFPALLNISKEFVEKPTQMHVKTDMIMKNKIIIIICFLFNYHTYAGKGKIGMIIFDDIQLYTGPLIWHPQIQQDPKTSNF